MKKVFSIIGMVVGLAFVIVGLVAMSGAMGGRASYPGSAPYGYDSGYAEFGADYYTYSVNNTAETASAARTTANNIRCISDFLLLFCGLSSMLFGLVIICAFGIVFASCIKKAEPCAVNVLSYPVYKAETPAEEAAE